MPGRLSAAPINVKSVVPVVKIMYCDPTSNAPDVTIELLNPCAEVVVILVVGVPPTVANILPEVPSVTIGSPLASLIVAVVPLTTVSTK